MTGSVNPPLLPRWLLRVVVPRRDREFVLQDLDDEFAAMLAEGQTARRARRWYWAQVLTSLGPSVARRWTRDERSATAAPSLRVWFDSLLQDVRFGVRSLRRRPLFTAVVLSTLGIGIGATTTIFNIVDGVLLQRLPYEKPAELVNVWQTYPGWRDREILNAWWDRIALSYPEYLDWSDHVELVEATALYHGLGGLDLTLTGLGEPEVLTAGSATASLLQVLGVRPTLGRWFLPGEDGPAAHHVVVLSHRFWEERFGADPDVLGRTIALDNVPHTVIGVVPPEFRLRMTIDWDSDPGFSLWRGGDTGERSVWVPVGGHDSLDRGNRSYEAIGRLAAGVSLTQALAETVPLIRGERSPEDLGVRMARRSELEVQGLREPVMLLGVASVVLLLIACGNVATLLLGEAVGRRQEVATRVALGAGHGRIMRQLLTESLLLGVLGSALGVVLAWGGTRLLVAVAPPTARVQDVAINAAVLLFASTAGIVAALVFGLAPSVMVAGRATDHGQRGGGGDASGSRRSRGFQRSIVSLEIALTVMLLVTGGLLARTVSNLFDESLGFDSVNLGAVEVSVTPNQANGGDASVLYEQILERTNAIAGVHRASATTSLPFLGGLWSNSVRFEDQSAEPRLGRPDLQRRVVSPGFHETLGIPLLDGRWLTASDRGDAANSVVISESMARRYWPNESAIGSRIRFFDGWWTIVGVVGDVKDKTIARDFESTVYHPHRQIPRTDMTLVVRASSDPLLLIPQIRAAIRTVDSDALIRSASTMTSLISQSAIDERYRALLMLAFALSATMLAAVGVFGVTARGVAQRTREMGVRMALGARDASLIRMVMGGSLLTIIGGIALGLLATLWSTRLLARFLFGVQAWDLATYGSVVVTILGISLIASYLPARRAARLNPVEILRG